jgi:hypothetical protein
MASGNSWTLGQRDRSVVVEASANAVDVVDDGERALHTNHALVQHPFWEYLRFESSADRLAQLESTVSPAMSLDHVRAMYSTGVICQSRNGPAPVMSVGTMIFELGDTQVCHFAAGPLDEEELRRYTMTGGSE